MRTNTVAGPHLTWSLGQFCEGKQGYTVKETKVPRGWNMPRAAGLRVRAEFAR